MRSLMRLSAACSVVALLTIFAPLALSPGLAKGDETPPPDVASEELVTTMRFETDGSSVTVQHGRLRALTAVGRTALSQLGRAVDRSRAALSFDKVVTVKKDGRRLPADPASAVDVTLPFATVAPMYADLKHRVIQVPNLEVGDALEFQFTLTETPIILGQIVASYQTDWRAREGRETVVLDLPADRAVTIASPAETLAGAAPPTVETRNGRTVRSWRLEAPAGADRAKRTRLFPTVFVASSLPGWASVGDWYLGLESDALEATPEIRDLAARLTEGKTTAREKAEAIFDYVSSSVRYVSLAMGIHGYKPHRAADVLRNSYGDCKDKTALMKALFAAAGIPARSALVSSDGRIPARDVPAFTQFDHVMTVVTLDGVDVWLDAAMQGAGFGQLPPTVYNSEALVLESGATRLAPTPPAPVEPQVIRVASAGRLDAAGTLTLETKVTVRSIVEPALRALFREGNKQLIEAGLMQLAQSQAPEPELSNVSSSDPGDTKKPFEVSYTLRKSGFANLAAKTSSFATPSLASVFGVDGISWAAADDENRTPAGQKRTASDFPFSFEETVIVALPEGMAAEAPTPVKMVLPEGEYISEYTVEGRTLRVRRALVLRKPTVALEQVASFDALRRLGVKDLAQRVGLKGGRSDAEAFAALSADELNTLGMNALDAGAYEVALAALQAATQKDPTHKWAFNNLGRAYFRLDRLPEAEVALRRQLEINAYDEYAWANLGDVLARQRRFADAEAAFRRHIEIDPLNVYAYRGLALALLSQERASDAVEVLERVVRVKREDATTLVLLAGALRTAGREDEARKVLDSARQLPGFSEAAAKLPAVADIAFAPATAPVQDEDSAKLKARRDAALSRASALTAEVAAAPRPDESFRTVAKLVGLAETLDELGQVAVLQSDRANALLFFQAALDISLSPQTALRLAQLEAEEGRTEPALDHFALASLGGDVNALATGALEKLCQRRYKSPAARKQDLKSRSIRLLLARKIGVQQITLPKTLSEGEPPSVLVRVLVDRTGRALAAKAVYGSHDARATAEADALRIRYPVVTWPGGELLATRSVMFSYSLASGFREAFWGFGPDPVGEFAGGVSKRVQLPM